ncbi:helix-turn-helix transcriptional regulator [Micromonospora sp. WMMD1128]|uniref:PadR family transcriptional regulator n=1 Tax=unclassified Micromonospora TaxID=2617518 RepID=UPI00248AA7E2|nr:MULTISPECIES: helix-turn-helix transcriptional regulator [unclassified Micromonospora]WBB75174.1 helix-turn-helix transcriptional regulator [Micromonospora sp. WMMD1128]WFE31435.1 helix-turn-helix transcriptional regulator [Micromonospora sp. WMMD975]
MRLTIPVIKVLSALLAEPDAPRYGLDLMRLTGLPSGTLYPVLHRLQAADWLAADWEDVDPIAAGRPARRYYRLTGEGIRSARLALAELRALAPAERPHEGAGPAGAPAW